MLAASSGFASDVMRGYDYSVDFSRYRTFMWIAEPNSGNALVDQRIVDAVNFQLQAKGFYLVEDNADLAVSANIVTGSCCSLESLYSDLPADWDWRHYWGPQTSEIAIEPQAKPYEAGTLVVNLFDTQKRQSVWWGATKHAISEATEDCPKHFDKRLAEMFSGYQWWTTMP